MGMNIHSTAIVLSPRYSRGDVLLRRYLVKKVVDSGPVYQVLRVQDQASAVAFVLKVFCRARVSSDEYTRELNWFQNVELDDGRRSSLFAAFQDRIHRYFVFERADCTLRSIITHRDEAKLYIPPRHYREIMFQLLTALKYLHQEGIHHSDVRPQMIEFEDTTTVTEEVLVEMNRFSERNILRRTKLSLVFYGSIGRSDHPIEALGTDQYRAPEVVFNLGIGPSSDLFSAGCIMFELLSHGALFPYCDNVDHYIKNKAVLYNHFLGPFPSEVRQKINDRHPDFFPIPPISSNPFFEDGIVDTVRGVLARSLRIEDYIEDRDALDVLYQLLDLSAETRYIAGSGLLNFDYFLAQ